MDFNQDWKYLFTSFEGRINRAPFWAGVVVLFLVSLVVTFVLGLLHLSFLGNLFALVMVYPGVALYAKRWHDRSKSGWWSLVMLIPLLGLIYAIYEIGIQEGVPEDNQYGSNPLARA
ncbi:DUF805 domain-containing protein [Devosia rhodophyticola]|uniref:DUF805 domain-containing protein n=1 Tax=Devosia rhodophyticola TaxID=3026423 RepID=A0ABY7Z160_9HYPH|nr:DUF805 domain-containing protein [Devosia rhodophyticola]WDR06750.1 DUF805 domain-containing protein [Devosia rhodophyticola]